MMKIPMHIKLKHSVAIAYEGIPWWDSNPRSSILGSDVIPLRRPHIYNFYFLSFKKLAP
jgi:hypothetical protein